MNLTGEDLADLAVMVLEKLRIESNGPVIHWELLTKGRWDVGAPLAGDSSRVWGAAKHETAAGRCAA